LTTNITTNIVFTGQKHCHTGSSALNTTIKTPIVDGLCTNRFWHRLGWFIVGFTTKLLLSFKHRYLWDLGKKDPK
jgi:hypothetical protein